MIFLYNSITPRQMNDKKRKPLKSKAVLEAHVSVDGTTRKNKSNRDTDDIMHTIKKSTILILILFIVFSLYLFGYSRITDNRLLKDASPENSAMSFFYFDGETTTIKWLFDLEKEKQIISQINSLRVNRIDETRIKDFSVPCYGLRVLGKDGFDICLTYNDGLWLDQNGNLYEAAFDFESTYSDISNADMMTYDSGISMVNSSLLYHYDIRYCKKAQELSAFPEGISLSFVNYSDNNVTLLLTNNSSESFFYGEDYSLQIERDNIWYALPTKPNYSVTLIASKLPSGTNREITCSLDCYGKLSAGHYRIIKQNMSAEFHVE